MQKILICMCLLALLFTGCGEKEQIETLRSEAKVLNAQMDSLNAEWAKLRNINQSRIIGDTVCIGDGPFHVYARLRSQIRRGGEELEKIFLAMQDSVDFQLRVGETFFARLDSNDYVQVLRYAPNPTEIHLLSRKDSGYVYTIVEKPVVKKHSIYEGTLEEGSTLNGILSGAGFHYRMVGVVCDALQSVVPFSLARAGDKFRIFIEDSYYKDVRVRGKVIYAEFDGRNSGHHEVFRYEDDDSGSSYNSHYIEDGRALVSEGLRYPLERLRIASYFGPRVHPITGRYTTHYGVDYEAPVGTIVHAVADGEVVVSGYDDYSGNKIAIKHMDNLVSWYMHLSARDVEVGEKIVAGQNIGKVGSTGRSTGPHLHYGLKNERGTWINPLSKTMIATPKLEGERLARFKGQVDETRKLMELTLAAPAAKVNDSTNVTIRRLPGE